MDNLRRCLGMENDNNLNSNSAGVMSIKEQFEHAEDCYCQSGWICPECSKECREWREFHEPLARIYREVKKALPHWDQRCFDTNDVIESMIINDKEISTEIKNLLDKIIQDIENEH